MVTGRTERYREIAEVLVRFGWTAAADRIGLRTKVPSFTAILERHGFRSKDRGKNVEQPDVDSGPERLRRVFEELGPTFIKLGQMLATRPDVLPTEYAQELSRLQDETTPLSFADIRTVIHSELGAEPSELYGGFEEKPLAVASIGQAHKARLHDGRDVVVKVRKPGVAKQVQTDLAILAELTEIGSREWELINDFGIPALVDSFDRSLRAELDYANEAHNAARFRENLADDPTVYIPEVFMDLSSSRVLTEEFASGLRIDDVAALDTAGVDRAALADAATRTVIQMVLIDGFFHADPHPGNLFVRSDGGLWLIDFGMAGEISDDLRGEILWLVLALGNRDVDGVMRRLLRIAPPRASLDRRSLRSDVSHLMETVGGSNLADMSMLDFFRQLTSMIRRHRLELPGNVSTLLRMLVLTESSAVVLDPSFHIGRVVKEVGQTALLGQLSPRALARRMSSSSLRAAQIASDLPERGLRLLDDYEARGIEVRLNADDLEPVVERVEATGDRLIAGITMGALIVGIGSVISTTKGRVGRWRDPLMVAAGGAAGLLGTYITASTGAVRSGRRFVRRLWGLSSPRG